jgi:hypothetical protein
MSDNKKQEKDFTKEVDARLLEAAEIVKVCVSIEPSNILIRISLRRVNFRLVWIAYLLWKNKQEM